MVLEFQRLLSEELLRAYQRPGDGHLAQLLACYSSATGQVVKYTFADHEAAYVAMRLLSPVWELDQRWFERELLRELQSLGAHTKKTKVNSWQLWDLKVEAGLLDSYEGVVTSHRLLLYGFPQAGNQLICKFSDKVFRGLETTWPALSNPALEEPKAELTCLTGPHLMGTDIPMMLLDEEATRLQVLVEEREGDKPAFYRREAFDISRPIISQALHRNSEWWKNEKTGNSWDVWLEDSSGDIAKGQLYLHELRPLKIVESENQNEVAGIKYWGPLMTRRFGLLGYLTELYWDLV
ncbi:MAG: hypothetical protein K2P81_05220 [Bacteriovoracaceae bacterium]|nr:hypothetical protein [Bacteriovoracaceae bacterium]